MQSNLQLLAFLTADNIKILISILSLTFAVWQYLQKRRIKNLISLEAVELHKNIAIALGAAVAAIIAINQGQNCMAYVGRAQGLCQAVLYESAKLYCYLKDTKLDDIDAVSYTHLLAHETKAGSRMPYYA